MNLDIEKEKIQIEKDGKMVDCDVLFTFDCEDNMKSYIGYTDNSIGKNNRKNIYVSSYNPFGTKLELEEINDAKELEMVNKALIQFDKES